MTLASILIILVSGVFLVQSDFYGRVTQRTRVHESSRSVSDLVASEARSAVKGGVLVADPDRFVFRTPLAVAAVCAVQGTTVYAFLPGGPEIDEDRVAGFALQDSLTGDWTFHPASWSAILGMGGAPDDRCADDGADTTGLADHFVAFTQLGSIAPDQPDPGELVMVYREVEFLFDDSDLDPEATALFVGEYGQDLYEFATGMDSVARFEYRTGDTTHVSSVAGGQLAAVDGVRVWARTRARPETGVGEDVLFGWALEIPLRSAR